MIYARPEQQIEVTADGFTSGLVGTLGVQVLDTPANTVLLARATAGVTEAPPGSGLYAKTITAPAAQGAYSVVWDDGARYAREELTVMYSPPSFGPTSDNGLLTVDELKAALGDDLVGTADLDAGYAAAIANASTAIRNYARRLFNATQVTKDRDFEYDGSGYLDIDDADDINNVWTVQSGITRELTTYEYRAEPVQPAIDEPTVYTHIRLGVGLPYAPAMGFASNIDRLYDDGRWPGALALVRVNARWGWPGVPNDVKQATVWTASAFLDNPKPYQSASIAGYSWTATPMSQAIPARAIELLIPYARVSVA